MITELLKEIYQVNQGQCQALDHELAVLIDNIEQHGPEEIDKKHISSINKLRKNLQHDLTKQHTLLTEQNNQLLAIDGVSNSLEPSPTTSEEGVTTATLLRHVNAILENYRVALAAISKISEQQQHDAQELFIQSKAHFQDLHQQIDVNIIYKSELESLTSTLNNCNNLDHLLINSREVIALLLKNINSEKESSQHFLASLNDALVNVKHIVDDSVSLNKEAKGKRTEWNERVNLNVNNIKQAVSAPQEDVAQLVSKELTDIIKAMTYKQQFDQLEHGKLADQFTKMQQKLSLVERQAQNYKSQLDEQKQLNLQDTLTKLPNRAALDQRFASEFEKAKTFDKPLWVAVADIDLFKRINDSFGHNAGDKTLQVIASAISRSLRGSEFIARYGGEEFVILIPLANKHSVDQILNRVRENIKAIPFKFKQEHISITISLGATRVRLEDKTPEAAFERADQALYQAKNNGRDQVVIN